AASLPMHAVTHFTENLPPAFSQTKNLFAIMLVLWHKRCILVKGQVVRASTTGVRSHPKVVASLWLGGVAEW
ncbi:MAG TPA: hypothetical protein DCY88_10280, partial [Cyanobacteria bacterium UBA11372]|nr:hypothetical protein [Cyanobacteria bacterium UBA11372]